MGIKKNHKLFVILEKYRQKFNPSYPILKLEILWVNGSFTKSS